MIHFLKLVRYKNLLIIGFTMYSILFFYMQFGDYRVLTFGEKFDFFLLVFSTILIAAAGNIINDYFDVKADRINKPDKVIITKHIKKRWAIVLHWLLNGIAFLIGCYLSITYQTFWYVFIHLLSINILWFYSIQLKKVGIFGNILIALLTSLVPIIVGIHIHYHLHLIHESLNFNFNSSSYNGSISNLLYHVSDWWLICFFSGFAFVLNLARELIKDIQDIEGDQQIKSKSIAIVFGERKTRIISAIILLLANVSLIMILSIVKQASVLQTIQIFFPIFLIIILITAAIFYIIKSKSIYLSDLLIKASFIIAIALPFWWFITL